MKNASSGNRGTNSLTLFLTIPSDKLQCPLCLKTYSLYGEKGYNSSGAVSFMQHLQKHEVANITTACQIWQSGICYRSHQANFSMHKGFLGSPYQSVGICIIFPDSDPQHSSWKWIRIRSIPKDRISWTGLGKWALAVTFAKIRTPLPLVMRWQKL